TALFGTPVVIAASEPPAPVTWLGRLAHPTPPHLRERRFLPGTDGAAIRLPPSLPIDVGEDETLAVYRLLAVEQAARIVRRTADRLAGIRDAESRDGFLTGEAAAIARWIVREFPGLAPALRAASIEALAARPGSAALTDRERAVEGALRAALREA